MSRDLYPICSVLEWKLGIHLNEWRAARELSYSQIGKIRPELEQAHCEGVVKLLREYLDALEAQTKRPP